MCGTTRGDADLNPFSLRALGAADAADMRPGRHMLLQCGGSPVIVAATSTLGQPDFTFVADEAVAGDLWRSLAVKVWNWGLGVRSSGPVGSTADGCLGNRLTVEGAPWQRPSV